MPLKPEDKRQPVRVSGRVNPDVAERFSRYLTYLDSSADYVIAGALERTMDGDPNFRKWEREPRNQMPVATGKDEEKKTRSKSVKEIGAAKEAAA